MSNRDDDDVRRSITIKVPLSDYMFLEAMAWKRNSNVTHLITKCVMNMVASVSEEEREVMEYELAKAEQLRHQEVVGFFVEHSEDIPAPINPDDLNPDLAQHPARALANLKKELRSRTE